MNRAIEPALSMSPRPPRRGCIYLVVSVFAMAASTLAFAADHRQPYVPASDGTVLEHLPSGRDPRVRRFDAIRRQVAARPADARLGIALANAYLDYGRDTGDARYLGRAQAVVAPWLARHPPPVDALLVHATILQSRHQFNESRRVLEAILQRDPDNAQAWLTLSSVALVQGDMAEAQRDCAHLLGGSDALVAAGCIASRATLTGHAADALRVMQTVIDPREPPALLAWAHGLMADAARTLGQTKRADAEFRTALQLAPGDNFLIADYADFLLDNDRAREALALTRPYPQSDTSFLRQVLAESTLDLPQARAHIPAMASRFRDLERRGDSRLYAREEARFALWLQHDPARALALAKANWEHQRAPEDARIFLESALAAARESQAKTVLDLLDATQLEDPAIRALARRVQATIEPPPDARL